MLIADRNVRLLESISLTFAPRFTIHTANTLRSCTDLLRQSEFDLVVVCEKLTDGSGLQLLGQISRSSPDTLRVFAAKRARLQFLKGKLGPFGLFRTLPYPIDPRRLLSTLTLAHAGLLEVEIPAPPVVPPLPRVAPTSPSTARRLPGDASYSRSIATILARLQPPPLTPPRNQLPARPHQKSSRDRAD